MNSKWNLQLVRIYERGAQARREGKTLADNPYVGRGNLQRQRRRYWVMGFRHNKREK